MNQLSEELISKYEKLFLHHNTIDVHSAKTFSCNGKRKYRHELKSFLQEFFIKEAFDNPFIIEHKEDTANICDALINKWLSALVIERSEEAEINYFDLPQEDLDRLHDIKVNHIPVVDIISGRKAIVRKGGDLQVSPFNFDIFKDQYSHKEWSVRQSQIKTTAFMYHVGNDFPKYTEIATPQGLVTYPTCNLYVPPKWSFCEDLKAPLHPDHKKMIFTRFLDNESLERYLCVCYHMLTNRNKNIAGLVHRREGTGKSTVMGKIPGHLVGVENMTITDKNFISSPHKDAMLNKRMVFLDEHTMTKGQSSIVKQFVEDRLYINPKGKAAVTVPNTISFFMASNNEEDIYTEPTNRRHYFLEDSGKHIIEEFGGDFVASYIRRLDEDPEFLANLGYFILNNFKDPKYPADAVYRGRTFERIVKATCFPYYVEIIDQLESGEISDYLLYSDLKHDYNKKNRQSNKGSYFPRMQTFADFFNNFRWEGEAVCRVERLETDIKLYPL